MSTSSVPAQRTAIRGRGWTSTRSRPTAASRLICAGPIGGPTWTAGSPGATSSPVRRPWLPAGGAAWTATRTSPWSVQTAGTTTSAPAGSIAPAVTRCASPGPMEAGAPSPAEVSPTTASCTGASSVAAVMSAARTAYPSRAVWSNDGSSRRLTTSSAQSRPCASRMASSMGSTCGAAARISSRCRSTSRICGPVTAGGGDGMRSRSSCVVSRCRGPVLWVDALWWAPTSCTTVPRRRSICVVSRCVLSSVIPPAVRPDVVVPRRPPFGRVRPTDGAPAGACRVGDAPTSRQLGHELGEPLPQGRAQVVALAGQPDDRLEVVQLVTGVVPAAAEDDAVHGLAALDQGGQRVGQLDLPAAAGGGAPQHLEDLRRQHVAADDREAAGRLLDRRLLDQPGDAHDLAAVAGCGRRLSQRLDGDRARLVDVLPAHVEQGDHRAAVLGLHGEHVLQQQVAGVDEVVAEQDGERLVADERRGLQHRVAQAPGLALAHEVDLRDLGGGVHGGQPLLVALLLQRRLQLRDPVEEVLDRGLAAAGHHEHFAESGSRGLLDDVLQRRAVDYRQQLLGHGLGRRQEPGAQPRHGDDRLAGRTGTRSRHAGSLTRLPR